MNKSAILNGILGTALSAWVATRYFGFTTEELALSIFAANVAGFVSLLTTLKLERTPWVKRHILRGSFLTWTTLTVLYLAIIAAISAPMRDAVRMVVLFLPLLLSTGFMILLFGPVQDRIIRWEQRRARARDKEKPGFPIKSIVL